ncbi:RNA 3'-terminal phosphate cyclase (ATP) [Andreprevotia lacus DSM 23236]|jgi:RNA 3'-terminal phosphate cyclase (ATP)|uniref:RNA 3'-terminal phosphate cyclase n=1 Tax=Andreprevotia lacus DSM 23236 TaxID=1121001 RepID=A0A1W1Y0I3_9NEIS|nr:RNA 3'-terminal phosphate cyclase [Andreprevotia lacus]SMC29666.1 RNA 3'-terminal phosphate cyclase (ATP) [Andreprevotia lacus DSM 23236]
MKDWIELDGATGEGGGQILRSALTLAMITGTPFRIERIRAGRQKPGLLRQHLTAVQAAAAICGAEVSGAEAGSQTLTFRPGAIRGGDYHFAIGTAGSCMLVLQTVLPALWFADAPSTVLVSGGTHNKAAPPADFLIRSWAPLMARMGVQQTIALERHGFYPAGGGSVRATVQPVAALQPLVLTERGALQALDATAIVADVSYSVAKRELDQLALRLDDPAWPLQTKVQELPATHGPGNALLVELVHEHVTEVFTGFGERGISAESVANRTADELRRYLKGNAAVGEHLADQLLLPLALAGGGEFTATVASSHLLTNIGVIEKFLAVEVAQLEQQTGQVRVVVRAD